MLQMEEIPFPQAFKFFYRLLTSRRCTHLEMNQQRVAFFFFFLFFLSLYIFFSFSFLFDLNTVASGGRE